MSLVPEEKRLKNQSAYDMTRIEYDANDESRLPSGSQLVEHMANYAENILFMFIIHVSGLKCSNLTEIFSLLKQKLKINQKDRLEPLLQKFTKEYNRPENKNAIIVCNNF